LADNQTPGAPFRLPASQQVPDADCHRSPGAHRCQIGAGRRRRYQFGLCPIDPPRLPFAWPADYHAVPAIPSCPASSAKYPGCATHRSPFAQVRSLAEPPLPGTAPCRSASVSSFSSHVPPWSLRTALHGVRL